jgi:5-methylcytosine-specific restriction endonuclease McrA
MAVIKNRNNGTMSEAAFWGMIRATLRNKSRFWKPSAQCVQNAKRKYVGPNKKQKFEYQCNSCKKYFKRQDVNVDHIIPVGTLKSAQDLPGFVERLFCEVKGLQLLCKKCHDAKTKKDNLKTRKK